MGQPEIPVSIFAAVQWAVGLERAKACALGIQDQTLILSGSAVFDRLEKTNPALISKNRTHVKKLISIAIRQSGCSLRTRARGRGYGTYYIPVEVSV